MTARCDAMVEALIQELLAVPLDCVRKEVVEPRFWTPEVAHGLLYRSTALQEDQPEQSFVAALAAVTVFNHLQIDNSDPALLQRALCLSGNAARLLGKLDSAARAFRSQGLHLHPLSADLLHAIAVLRWEQARYDEAAGLLSRAEKRLRIDCRDAASTTTRQLLVLVHADLGEDDEALRLFTAFGPSDSESRPWLSARTALTAAFCLAGRPGNEPQRAARAALAQGRLFLRLVEDSRERVHLEWLSARALARLGNDPEAGHALAALRETFLAQQLPWIDCLLLHLDLLACHSAGDPAADLQSLDELLRRNPPSVEEMDVTRAVLGTASQFPLRTNPWESAAAAVRQARRLFRLFQLPAVPIPYLIT